MGGPPRVSVDFNRVILPQKRRLPIWARIYIKGLNIVVNIPPSCERSVVGGVCVLNMVHLRKKCHEKLKREHTRAT